MKQIAQGAEAIIYEKKETILKKRVAKGYRIKELDRKLRTARTQREAKLLKKLQDVGVHVPHVIKSEDSILEIEKINGSTLRDILDGKNCEAYCEAVGKEVALMHKANTIHGDLTTSNMIANGRVTLIDFGLGFVSTKVEDKAVDVHLFKQALASYHQGIFEKAYKAFVKGYQYRESKHVLQRLEIVEKRGRYKGKK